MIGWWIWGKSGIGAVWIGVAFALLRLTAVSTLFAFSFGFDFDPNDRPGSYYRAEIPNRQWVMAVSVAIPAMAAAASVRFILTLPRGFLDHGRIDFPDARPCSRGVLLDDRNGVHRLSQVLR